MRDDEHLRLLALFHYIYAGLTGLFSCFPMVYLGLGVVMISGGIKDRSGQGPPPELGWFFVIFAAAFILLGWVYASCVALAGRYLTRRRGYWFCFIVACLSCAFAPLGTVLGVFTLIVLLRPSVKAAFGVGGPYPREVRYDYDPAAPGDRYYPAE